MHNHENAGDRLTPAEIAALPTRADGRAYITEQMVANDPRYGAFLEHTSHAWDKFPYAFLWLERDPPTQA